MEKEEKGKKIVPSESPIKKMPSREVKVVEGQKDEPKKSDEKPNKKRRKWWIWLIVIMILGVIAYFGYGAYAVAKKIITDNRGGGSPFLRFFGDMSADKLKGEGDGRINILLLGIPGAGHNGMDLSDTVMVVSIDPVNKNVAMLSLPRDLYVPIPGNGETKINAAHAYGEQDPDRFGDGPSLAKETVSEILDLPIHYYFRMDFEGFEKLVDEIGGIEVYVEEPIVDPFYPDDRAGYSGNITYRISVGQHHMDGNDALKYARSRYTTSDFDRAKRQQIILKAIKERALSIGILTNPAKISGIMNIIGDHFRTDMQLWEMQRFAELMRDVDTEIIVHKVLDNTAEGLLYASNKGGAYVLLPRGNNWDKVQALAHTIFVEPYIKKENARIEVQNGTSTVGLGNQLAEKLREFGYNVTRVTNAAPGDYPETLIIDYTGGEKPYTLQLLKNRLSYAKVLGDGNPPSDDVDIIVVVGDNYQDN